jgi:hypothetical protein
MTMLRARRRHVIAAASVGLLLCPSPVDVARAAPAPTAAAAAECTLPFPLRSQDFSHALRIDNRFLPMRPGARLTYRGTTVDDTGKQVPHEVVFTVTDLDKVVDGIHSRVIHDVDRNDGTVTEAELAFFAQDDAGNVWNLGEYPEEYDNGEFTGAPSTWISGRAGATGGLHMLADPTKPANVGHEYLQGRASRIDFLDCAQITGVGGVTTVPAGRFTGVLTTHERSPLDPESGIQIKEHAPGVGIVRIGAMNDLQNEQLGLVSADTLTSAQLAQVDGQARALDRHAYQVSDVYGATTPVGVG